MSYTLGDLLQPIRVLFVHYLPYIEELISLHTRASPVSPFMPGVIRPMRWVSRWRRDLNFMSGLVVAFFMEFNVIPEKRCCNLAEAFRGSGNCAKVVRRVSRKDMKLNLTGEII
jgi:hypothetical protein